MFSIVTSGLQMRPAALGSVYFQEDYISVPTGNFALTPEWLGKGYSDFENSGIPSNIQVLTRAQMPTGLLSDGRFPAAKSKICLFNLSANEIISTILWSGFPPGVRTASFSWWEYRADGNLGGEKFCRVGNFISGPGSANGIDAIWTLGAVTGLTLISNSLNMHQWADAGFGQAIITWPPGLNHFESVCQLSTGLNSDGVVDFYQNGTRIAHVPGLQFFDTLAQAAVPLQFWNTGGWSSAGNEGGGTYPIKRYLCALRVASQQQGVWNMAEI